MDAQVQTIEARLQSFLGQLQSELGVLDRIVHKNKNQHRRSSYFQYLLKVRRDSKLLQSINLEEIVNSSFLVINGNRPKQKVQLLERRSNILHMVVCIVGVVFQDKYLLDQFVDVLVFHSLKRRKCDGGKHNFLARLEGAARLLSQMVEPMLKAAIEISTLLARSFFMGFSMTVLALLSRLRVLTQQILLDVVSVFNMVSTLSHKQQSIKLNQQGIEAFHSSIMLKLTSFISFNLFVFREYYPTNEQAVFLECVWETDKFVLLERKSEPEIIKDDVIFQGSSTVQYQTVETILGENKSVDRIVDKTSEEDKTGNLSSMDGVTNDCKQVDQSDAKDDWGENLEHEQTMNSSLIVHPNDPCKPELKKKVAFITVKTPIPSKGNDTGLPIKQIDTEKEDPFFSLLTGGSQKDSIF
ncbi:hypothetical protein Ccrd_025262 [Cynara cardunculus var. scolymus]|uniref:Nucleolus and neural progenitor protein-like N-terminal domain-containing protein n=1 Tax=Cynara cardunculus var. scolymus TaxID=59895 RepID=A0A103XB54_CYNCS|nr:hypothetical protein Ccrd_025262 [Cynara cardunculus var. scolymus]